MIFLNGALVKFGNFPNGESNLNFNNLTIWYDNEIVLKYETDQDLFNLYILKKYLDIKNSTYNYLEILYMPYSRMDRQNQFYTFNLKYVCEFINSMKWNVVCVYDTHSEVTDALLDKFDPQSNITNLFTKFRAEYKGNEFCIMFPDAGAQKRYSDKFQGYSSVVGIKKRDFSDGKILSFDIVGDLKQGSDVVIIDDLCSKGGTFIGAATKLKELGANKIYLVVSHCENTIFEGDILKTDLIETVYTTNSILSDNLKHDKLTVTKIY